MKILPRCSWPCPVLVVMTISSSISCEEKFTAAFLHTSQLGPRYGGYEPFIGYHSSLSLRAQKIATQHPAGTPNFYACFVRHSSFHRPCTSLRVLDDGGLETLGVLDVDGLDVRVQLLLGALLVVTLTRDADTEAERDTLDARLPHLLVELGVEADVLGALSQLLARLLCVKALRHSPRTSARDCAYAR